MPHQLPRTKKRRLWCEMRETWMRNQVPWQSLRSGRLPQMCHNLQIASLCDPLPSSHSPFSSFILFIKLYDIRPRNPNAKPFAKTPVVTGNAPNLTVPNPSANSSARTPTASPKSPAADVMAQIWDKPLWWCSKKLKKTPLAVNAKLDLI